MKTTIAILLIFVACYITTAPAITAAATTTKNLPRILSTEKQLIKSYSFIDSLESANLIFKYFQINGIAYLFLGQSQDKKNYYVDSILYQWNGTSFTSYQEIATVGCHGAEYFEVSGNSYLALAFYYTGSTHLQNSKILKSFFIQNIIMCIHYI